MKRLFDMFFFKKTAPKEAPVKKEPSAPKFFARLTQDIGPVVWAVSEEKHFIRVYGEKGEDRILYRFSDAVHDLKAFDGNCVHLQHWVLKGAVKKVEKVDGTYEIILKNDVRFPVCESYRRILHEAEWEMGD
ncbi:LytTR family transcriptional regulator DNA-binding domain-containing protein [Terasakiella sp. SH-1]|uniref:LytTR family transcriptional regulator DNA-binding domain-containing protein n=1 Tax=Terasakiella sp. SH-1 TaxID=2560057 RepID=UPI0010731ADF|nr:LytTR family transcriptional regulator DNA-binding domain-containing protein [Terasakiella sp. SH-1]